MAANEWMLYGVRSVQWHCTLYNDSQKLGTICKHHNKMNCVVKIRKESSFCLFYYSMNDVRS
jgi:hypothetical protein